MADCAVARCLNERRLFRKHLQKWTKNLLFIAGLERIAEELTGSRKWKSTYPFNTRELEEPQDWDPDEKCYICNKCHPSSHSMHPSHSENACIDSSATNCDCGGNESETKHSSEQPLDLSVHNRDKQTDRSGSEMVTNSVLKVPQPSTAKSSKRRVEPSGASKRSYTEAELQAALADIQTGKLGTRRAAMIYGIPRSTLRNKVYKLTHDKANANAKRKAPSATETSSNNSTKVMNNNTAAVKTPLRNHRESSAAVANNNSVNDVHNNSTYASESLKQILKQAITQRANNNYTVQDFNSCSSKSHPPAEADTSTQMCNLFADPFAAFHMLSAVDSGHSGLSPLLSQFLLNVQHLALMRSEEDLRGYNFDSLLSGNLTESLMPDLVRKLTEERLEKERSKNKEENDVGNSSNVILKVPSYKPKHSADIASKSKKEKEKEKEKESGDDDKECTQSSQCSGDAKLVEGKEEKVKEKLNSNFYNHVNDYSDHDSSSDALNSESKSLLDSKSDKRTSSLNTSDQSNPSTPDGKRNRPKRGRYRNYNRDDLAKAVRAVQKGEMSVHRAGTLYGVPHSTLEYKVKERHLLRPKKRQTSASHSSSSKKVEPKSAKSSSAAIKSNSSQSSGSPNSYAAVSLPFWQATLPLLSGDLGPSQSSNFFASNMMRRLQENARLNEESHQQTNNNNNGNDFSLLENVIKSSLDKKSINLSKDSEDSMADIKLNNASLAALKEVSALDNKKD